MTVFSEIFKKKKKFATWTVMWEILSHLMQSGNYFFGGNIMGKESLFKLNSIDRPMNKSFQTNRLIVVMRQYIECIVLWNSISCNSNIFVSFDHLALYICARS